MANTLIRYFKKNIFDSVLLVVVLIFTFILVYTFDSEVFWSPNHRIAYLEVDDSGTRRAFEGEVVPGMTVLDALDASSVAGNINFKYEIDKKSHELHIITFNGYLANKTSKTATLFLNLVRIDIGKIHSIPINSGDRILVKLE